MNSPFNLEPAAWATLRRLLDDALALTPAAREPWLDALGPEVEALKPPLRRLLQHAGDDNGTDARFDSLPELEAAPAETTHRGDAPPPCPPDAGPYRPIRLLGEGGMSSVWLAERTDVLLNRPVALKLPRATWRHPGLAQRMAQEREILALLEHPHIARIYDAGVAADGQPYLALEYVEGLRIDEHCREQGLTVKQRVALFLQVTDAVAHAHAKLVVHRDLKPSNILVTPGGEVRLLDFGIAKLVGEAQAGQPELTLNAARVMTPHYAAPEQILGQPISTATDIYALGVVLYELLTGQRPYRPARETSGSLEEAILHADPERPSAAVADNRLARSLRGDLDTIVLKALKKLPDERYASVTAFADDLRNWLSDRPVHARPDSARYRAIKYVLRNRLAIGVVSMLVLSLSAGLIAALWQRESAVREAAKANAIKDYLVGLFEANDIEQHDGLRKRQQSVQQLLEESAHSLGQGLDEQPEVRDELQQVVGGLLNELELTESAVLVRRQRVEQLGARGADVALRVSALKDLAHSQSVGGNMDAARGTLAQAFALCAQGAVGGTVACQSARLELGGIEFDERHIEAAMKHVEPAAQALRRIVPGSIQLADAVELMAQLRIELNRGEEALPLFRESIALRRDVWGAQSVRLAIARYRLGRSLWVLRHLSQAETELRAAWEIVAQALGPDHVISAQIELFFGRLVFYLGLRSDGLEHIRHASGVILSRAERYSPNVVLDARVLLGNALLLDGFLTDAGSELEQALAMREEMGNQAMADPTLDQSYSRYLLDRGRFAEARAWLGRFRERIASSHGKDHPEVAEASLRIANVCIAEGRLDEAQRELDSILNSQDASEMVFGSAKHKAQLARAALFLEQGRAEEAQPLIDAQLDAAHKTPREDQYRDILYRLYDLSARAAAQRRQFVRANDHFERAISLLAVADARHPYLATTRARFADSLLQQGQTTAARFQIKLAQAALQAQPETGPQFWRPLREALAHLAQVEQAHQAAIAKK